MEKIYLIPGLGADESVFSNYQFPKFEKKVIRWIAPDKGESLARYAKRLAASIDIEDPVLVGVSFGGMIAVEIANLLPKSRLVLISSVKSYKDISLFKRILAGSGIIRLIPDSTLTRPTILLFWFFGVDDIHHKNQLSEIIRNTSPSFLKWAIGAIGRWKGQVKKLTYLQIHGNRDLLLPLKEDADQVIANAGHFLVVERSKEVESLIVEWLKTVKHL